MDKREHLGITNNLSTLYLKVNHVLLYFVQSVYVYREY